MRPLAWGLGILALASGTSASDASVVHCPASGPSFQGLGFLATQVPNDDEPSSSARGVSSDGSLVVGLSVGELGNDEAFFWHDDTGSLVALPGAPSGSPSEALAVSSDGSVVVGDIASGATRWDLTKPETTGVAPSNCAPSYANAVSADGSVVVGYVGMCSPSSLPGGALRWSASGGFAQIDMDWANAVSADGSVIVGYTYNFDTLQNEASLLSGAGFSFLGTLADGDASSASGVSADGSVVVGSSGSRAFRWDAINGMVPLERLAPAEASSADAVSADGSVSVGRGSLRGAEIWYAPHIVRSIQDVLASDLQLDLTGWQLVEAHAISADGHAIVGDGTDPDGNTQAWRACIPVLPAPEPSPALLQVAAVTALVVAAGRG